ncbi:MAG: alpha/beta hydrolase [Gemmatimonas sp.]|nr:alpha/beta hydrolase-fold protein [Gemmatimonadaceae bacterium]
MSDEQKPHTLTGNFRMHEGVRSRFLESAHDIIVYLPPGYDEDVARRYPVLYMQDGQNLFDDATAFSGEWHLDAAAEQTIGAGLVAPLIIVGIYNAGAYRIDEYTPTRDSAKRAGGDADRYGRMLLEELKPFIDAEYRTLDDARNTGIGGSSLGGLVSLYLALKYSGRFWNVAVLSPSVWWDNRFIVRRVRALYTAPPLRIWLSTGTAEGEGVVAGARRVRDALLAKGWIQGETLHYEEVEGGRHTESAWAAIAPAMLQFLFPASR